MRRIFSILFVFFSLYGFANVRAPYYIDQYFSGVAKVNPSLSNIYLIHEEIKALFPEFDMNGASALNGKVTFDIEYIILNGSKMVIDMPAAFLGVNVEKADVYLNGTALSAQYKTDNAAGKEFLIKLSEHRIAWKGKEYDWFINSAKNIFLQGNILPENDVWLESLKNLDPGDYRLQKFVSRFDYSNDPAQSRFKTLAFNLNIQPGTNSLSIRYRQGLFVNERSTRYGGIDMNKAVVGFDYLFYPALTWNLSPDFILDIKIQTMDFHDKFLIFDMWYLPHFLSNLEFRLERDSKNHMNYYKAEYGGFPAGILTFLVEKGD